MIADSVPLGVADRGLSVKVYEEIRERIIEGALPPGTRLRELDLAAEFRVSRVPIRQALPRLESDGFIVTVPRRGSTVTQLTLRDVCNLFDVRCSLEPLAARLAARRVGEGADGRPLRAALETAELATRARDPKAIAAANVALHSVLTTTADNDLLAAFMAGVNGRLAWLFRLTCDRDVDLLCEEHRRLVDAVLAADETAAEQTALVHVENGRAPSLAALAGVLPPR